MVLAIDVFYTDTYAKAVGILFDWEDDGNYFRTNYALVISAGVALCTVECGIISVN